MTLAGGARRRDPGSFRGFAEGVLCCAAGVLLAFLLAGCHPR